MQKQEERRLAQLYNYLRNWLEDQLVGWDHRTPDFKRMHQFLQLQQQALGLLLTDKTPLTVEERVAKAIFYVEDGVRYTIDYYNNMDREFHVSDDDGNERDIDYYAIPADAYLLGTHKL